MKVNVRGKNKYVPTLDVKERAEKKLQKMDQYFKNPDELQADVVCKAYESFEGWIRPCEYYAPYGSTYRGLFCRKNCRRRS